MIVGIGEAVIVSIAHGPPVVAITIRLPATNCLTSYVYVSRRPRKRAMKAKREPAAIGVIVLRRAISMLAYQAVVVRIAGVRATSLRGARDCGLTFDVDSHLSEHGMRSVWPDPHQRLRFRFPGAHAGTGRGWRSGSAPA